MPKLTGFSGFRCKAYRICKGDCRVSDARLTGFTNLFSGLDLVRATRQLCRRMVLGS